MSETWVQWVLSAGAGALVTIVLYRTKLALMDRRIESRKAEIQALRAEMTSTVIQRMDTMRRQQIVMLEILSDIARKVGVDSRFSDAVVRFLAEEAPTHNSVSP